MDVWIVHTILQRSCTKIPTSAWQLSWHNYIFYQKRGTWKIPGASFRFKKITPIFPLVSVILSYSAFLFIVN
jgi:hypothetical protein